VERGPAPEVTSRKPERFDPAEYELRCSTGNADETGVGPWTQPTVIDLTWRGADAREPRPHAGAAIGGPTTVTSGIGCSAHCGGSIPAASAAVRAQWRSKPAGEQISR